MPTFDEVAEDENAPYDGRLNRARKVLAWKAERPIPFMRALRELQNIAVAMIHSPVIDRGEIDVDKALSALAIRVEWNELQMDAFSFNRYQPTPQDRSDLRSAYEGLARIISGHSGQIAAWYETWKNQIVNTAIAGRTIDG